MSDNRKRYRTIKQSLKQLYPHEPQGNQARHLTTLAALISGIVGSRSCQLPDIASKVPDGNKKESRVKRYTRWLQNERITSDVYFLPYAAELLATLATTQSLLLAIDGSEVGRGCVALMISVTYKQRALPLVWVVVAQAKGHLAEAQHVQLLAQAQALVPAGATVIVVGDGEFDGVTWQATLQGYGWEYVCRTAKNVQLGEADAETLFPFETVNVQPGECLALFDVTSVNSYMPSWRLPGGMPLTSNRSIWCPIWPYTLKPVTGIVAAIALRLFSRTRKVAASTCKRAISPIRPVWRVCSLPRVWRTSGLCTWVWSRSVISGCALFIAPNAVT